MMGGFLFFRYLQEERSDLLDFRRSEELIKGVIAGQRDRAFVVSKVEADQVTGNAIARACDGSLARY